MSDKYSDNLFSQPKVKNGKEDNGIEEFYVCLNCGRAYSNVLKDKYGEKCHECGGRLKKRK